MQQKVREKETVHVRHRRASSERFRRLLGFCAQEMLWGCFAWLFGQAPLLFDTYPLGVALLCASEGHTLSILLGLVASAFWQMPRPGIYVCVYTAGALVRAVIRLTFEDNGEMREELADRVLDKMRARRKEKDGSDANITHTESGQGRRRRMALRIYLPESVRLQMALSAICAFVLSLFRVIGGGFRYYDLFSALFMLLLTPVAVLIYSVSLGGRIGQRTLCLLSRAALLFSLIFAADGITVAGLSLSAMLALFFTLYVTANEGGALGAVAGILCGVAYGPLYAPAFLLASLSFALFRGGRRQGGGMLLAVLAHTVWSVYVGGVEMLTLMLLPCLVAATAFHIYLRFFAKEDTSTRSDGERALRMRMEGTRYQDSSDRFRGISDAFASLSEMFYNLSDRFRRPGTLDLRRVTDSSFDAFCADCPNKSVCWGLEYSDTVGVVGSLISALHTKGRVTRTQISPALLHRCESVDAILERINRECAKLTAEMLCNNRTEIVAMDYESAASIINDALEEDDGEYRFDAVLEQKIGEYLKDVGIFAHSVTVYGQRRRQIVVRGVDVEQATVTVETLRSDLGELCGLELSCPVFELEGKVGVMTLKARKKLAVIGAQNNVSADGGVSGDSVNLFSSKKDYFYALISDGMGAGRAAAETSGLCSVFLEKMLRAGNRASTSLRMLNNMICSRDADSTRECSTTVDLMELDLMSGVASFIKSGAAPSFIVRASTVRRLQAGTLPIGIIQELDLRPTEFALRAGDTVVMISDGILQDDEECEWITSYLSGASSLTPAEIVYHICLHAAEKERHDDCSAIALRIQSAAE